MESKVYYLTTLNIDAIAKTTAEELKKGGVVVIPTDTIYGIVALDGNDDAIDRIYRIKRRPRDKKLIRLIGSLDLLIKYTEQYPKELIDKYWPGPLTIVFKARSQGTVALRYPKDVFLERLFKYLGQRAIVAPSANISGDKELFNCNDIIAKFRDKVDIIVCNDKSVEKKASTIIDISDENNWRIIRQGELEVELSSD